MDTQVAADGFAAMGSKARLEILRKLVTAGEEGINVGELQKAVAIPASTLAHHINFLAGEGLISQEKKGRTIYSRANFEHLRLLASFILAECCSAEIVQPNELAKDLAEVAG